MKILEKNRNIRRKIEKRLLENGNISGGKNKIFPQDSHFYECCDLRVDHLDLVTGSRGKLKKAARCMLDERDSGLMLERAGKLGLRCLVSKFFLEKSASDGLLRAVRKGKIGGKYQKIIYISSDKKRIESIRKLEEKIFSGENPDPKSGENITKKIGELFGYPKCCVRFFSGHISSATPELNHMLLGKSKAFLWRLNNLDDRINLLPHIPCRYDCQKSAVFAEKSFELVRKLKGEETVKRMENYLRSPFIYFKSGRFIRLEGRFRKGMFFLESIYYFEPEIIPEKYSKEKKIFFEILRNMEKSEKIAERKKNILVVGKKDETLLELGKFKDWCVYAHFI